MLSQGGRAGWNPIQWISLGNVVSAFAGLAVGLIAVGVAGLANDDGTSPATTSAVSAAAETNSGDPATASDRTAVGRDGRAALTARAENRTVRFGAAPLSETELAFAASEEQAMERALVTEVASAASPTDDRARLTARSRTRTIRFGTVTLTPEHVASIAAEEWWAAPLS